MRRKLTKKDIEYALKGGSVYACGGGGWVAHGRELATAAINSGEPELISVDELDDEAWVATAAAIGAPGGLTEWEMRGEDYVKAVDLLQKELGEPVAALMIGQNGMSSTVNAWLPSAVLGTKVLDAVGDLRAHPTGDMGSIGMAGNPNPSIQTAVGGNRSKNSYIELVTRGSTAKVSPILRKASDMSGGFIASCRNPLKASYVKENAALGGISMALELGQAISEAEPKGGAAVIQAICDTTKGNILINGTVTNIELAYMEEAFDVGKLEISNKDQKVIVHVMNEYMAVDDENGQRIATYPDVLTTLNSEGVPLSAGEVKMGHEINLLHVPKHLIPLSSAMKDPVIYEQVERIMGINIAEYAIKGI